MFLYWFFLPLVMTMQNVKRYKSPSTSEAINEKNAVTKAKADDRKRRDVYEILEEHLITKAEQRPRHPNKLNSRTQLMSQI